MLTRPWPRRGPEHERSQRACMRRPLLRLCLGGYLFCLIGLLLSGCGSAVPAPKTPETAITFACSSGDLLAYQLAAEAFHQDNPALTVRVVLADTLTSAESTTPADVQANVRKLARGADAFVWPSIAVEAGPNGLVRDLGPFLSEAQADAWLPGALAHFQWQGRQWGLPAGIDPLVVIYAPVAFEQAGLPLPSSTWTWDDLRAAARKLAQQPVDQARRFGFVDHELDGFAALLAAQGVVWDERQAQTSPLDLTDSRVAAASRWYASLVLDDQVMPEPTATQQFDPLAAVQRGEAGMAVAPASWFIYAPAEARRGLSFAPLPGGSPALTWGYFISAGSAHPEAAWQWLAYASQHVTPYRQLPAVQNWASQLPTGDVPQAAAALLDVAVRNLLPPIRPAKKEILLKDAVRRIVRGEDAATVLAEAQQQALAAPTVTAVGPFVVNTPSAESAATQTITFAALNISRYTALAQQFQEKVPEIAINFRDLEPAEAFASSAPNTDCFHLWGPPDEELRRQVRNLQPFVEAERTSVLNDYYQSALAPVRQDSALWGLPAGIQLHIWWYNRALFDEIQAPYPVESWTWDEILAAAQRLSSGKGAETQYGFVLQSPPHVLVNMLLDSNTAFAPITMRADAPIAHFDDPHVVALAIELANLARANAILRQDTTEATSGESAANAIRSGRVAMWLGSAPTYHRYSNDFYPAFLPHTGGVFWPSSSAYYISAATQSPLACWKWLRFLADQMPEENFLPARRSVMASPMAQQRYGSEAQRVYMQAANAFAALATTTPDYSPDAAWALHWLADALDQIIWKGADASTTLSAAQQKATNYFDCLGRCAAPATVECVTSCQQSAGATQ